MREDAATWFARMRGEDAERHRAAFEEWLAQSALHRGAYNRIGEVFAAGKALKGQDVNRSRPDHRPLYVGAGLAVLVVGVAAILLSMIERPHGALKPSVPVHGQMASAGTGRIRPVTLPHGGKAILDADAQIVTAVAERPAWSRLEHGRIRLAIDPAGPPRTILAGSFMVQSAGGMFDLWLRPDQSLDARILAGRVRIRPAVAFGSVGGRQSLQLVSGQHYRLRPGGGGASITSTGGVDWPRGVLEYNGASLADVLEEANRYGAVKIALADPALGQRHISGRFRIDGPLVLARRLAPALSLRLDLTQPGLIVLRS